MNNVDTCLIPLEKNTLLCYNETVKVTFCPQESWIIELHLKVQDSYPIDLGNILLLFRSIGYDQEELLNLTERELWYLRETITPILSVGNKTGMDVLKKIYKAIVKTNAHRLQVPGGEVEMPPALPEEEEEDVYMWGG